MAAPHFTALLAVQDLDTSIDQHTHRLAHLPEQARIAEIEAAAGRLRSQLAGVVAMRDEVAARQSEMEAELAATEKRSAMVSSRLYGGEVSAPKDLQAMSAEIESLKARASQIEDQILEVLEEREPLDASIGQIETELSSLATARQAAEESREKSAAVLRAELDELAESRSAAAGEVPADLLDDYTKIRARSGGVGAARLVGAQCGGCHLTLPSMELDRVRHAAPDQVVHCEECGRILVRPGGS